MERQPTNTPYTRVTSAKTLPFTHGARFYSDLLRNDALTAEKPFHTGKHTEYIYYLQKAIEVFQIFKHDLSGTPN